MANSGIPCYTEPHRAKETLKITYIDRVGCFYSYPRRPPAVLESLVLEILTDYDSYLSSCLRHG